MRADLLGKKETPGTDPQSFYRDTGEEAPRIMIALLLALACQEDPFLAEFRRLYAQQTQAVQSGRAEEAERLDRLLREKLHAGVRDHREAIRVGDKERQRRTLPRLVEATRILMPVDWLEPEAFESAWVLDFVELFSGDDDTRRKAYAQAREEVPSALKRLAPGGFQSLWPAPLSPADDGTEEFLSAFRKIEETFGTSTDEYEPRPRDPKQFLTRAQPILEFLAAGARKKGVRFPVEREKGVSAELKHLAPLIRSMKIVRAAALERKAAGDRAAASTLSRLAFDLASANVAEPVLISALVNVALADRACGLLEELGAEDLLAEDRAAVARWAAAWDPRTMLIRALRGEACVAVDSLENWVIRPLRDVAFLPDIETFLRRDIQVLLRRIEAQVATLESGWSGARADVDLSEDLPPLTGLLLPPLVQSARSHAMSEGRAQLVRIAVAAWDYRDRRGFLPDTLDALVPEYFRKVPADPWTGKAFDYREGILSSPAEGMTFRLR
jgi:hypothetical protein